MFRKKKYINSKYYHVSISYFTKMYGKLYQSRIIHDLHYNYHLFTTLYLSMPGIFL